MAKSILMFIAMGLIVLLAGCQTGEWAVSGGSNYETSQLAVMYSPDPNGGIGVRVMTDSVIPEDTESNVAVGPALEFALSDIALAVADHIVPGDWGSLQNAPVKVYGTLAFLWETRDADFLFLPGIRTEFLLKSPVHPYVAVERSTPEGSAEDLDEGVLTTFGAIYRH